MKIIVGLGNPGREYEVTRHNIGFMVLDNLVDSIGEKFRKSPFNAEICKTRIGTNGVILLKPTTYMNNSGQAVRAAMEWYNLDNRSLLVVYDDMDLPLGHIRLREKGSAGTHNGMRDIIAKVGETPRLRIGIGRPSDMDLKDYVLSNIDAMSKEIFDKVFMEAVDKITEFINK